MMENISNIGSVPPAPVCKFHLTIDGCRIGFVSLEQKQRFLKLRTCSARDGHRIIIHGLQSDGSGVRRARGKYYYGRVRLSDKVGRYNFNRNVDAL